jgi:hypothetical protein
MKANATPHAFWPRLDKPEEAKDARRGPRRLFPGCWAKSGHLRRSKKRCKTG